MLPKLTKWLDISLWLKTFANLYNFMLLKHSTMIPILIVDILYARMMFQLLDSLNWRVQSEIDNILAVSLYIFFLLNVSNSLEAHNLFNDV